MENTGKRFSKADYIRKGLAMLVFAAAGLGLLPVMEEEIQRFMGSMRRREL